jgi:hypothetical protein
MTDQKSSAMFRKMNTIHRTFLASVALASMLLASGSTAQAFSPHQASTMHRYLWTQSDPPVRMIPMNQGFCFLMGISGKFKGFGEAVRIYPQNGYWMLGGTSMQKGVYGRASCVTTDSISVLGSVEYTTEPAWKQFRRKSSPLAPTTGRVEQYAGPAGSFCYLTGVSGRLEDDTTIQVYSNYEREQILGLTYNGSDTSLRGEFGCLNSSSDRQLDTTGHIEWWQDSAPSRGPIEEYSICALTGMGGRFLGNGELVEVSRLSRGGWVLSGSSNQDNVHATMNCLLIY